MRILRNALTLAGAALLVGLDPAAAVAHDDHAPQAAAQGPTMTVFKSPTCGCCKDWVDHARKHGFKVVSRDIADVTPTKKAHGVPEKLYSCHTALVGGYVIEGHVPADLVQKLLKERPKVAGLAVPGMPMGSPGMEGPISQRYDVLTFDKAGKTTVYAKR
jgi:hypothetical protein